MFFSSIIIVVSGCRLGVSKVYSRSRQALRGTLDIVGGGAASLSCGDGSGQMSADNR